MEYCCGVGLGEPVLAASKRAGARLLIVAIAGALVAVLVSRAPDFGVGVAGVGDAEHAAAASSPSALRRAAEIHESAAIGADGIAANVTDTTPAVQDSRGELRTIEQRAAAIIATMAERMELRRDNTYADELVQSGLSRADSDAIAHRFLTAVAACGFEEVRRQYEAQGVGYAEFVAGAERVWALGPDAGGISLESVAMLGMPCVADAAQRAGITLPRDIMARYAAFQTDVSVSRDAPPGVASRPAWAEAAEAAIRAHVAAHAAVVLTSVDVRCEGQGCFVELTGPEVPIYDFEFDVFAEQNGFERPSLSGDEHRRMVWLHR